MQQSQRPGKGRSSYSCNREALLVVTVSAVLLAGFANPAEALPLDQQTTAQPEGGRPIKAKGGRPPNWAFTRLDGGAGPSDADRRV